MTNFPENWTRKEDAQSGRAKSMREATTRNAGPSPELEIERLLLAGFVPSDPTCASCGEADAEMLRCWVECAYAKVSPVGQPMSVADVLLMIFSPFVSLIVMLLRRKETREQGRDIIFPLPLRVCPYCRGDLDADEDKLKTALRRTPAYARLLDKYPEATASLTSLSL